VRIGVVQAGERSLQEDLIGTLWYLKRVYKKAGEGLFTRAYSERTRGSVFKQKECRFTLDTGMKFFTVSVVRPWNRFPREVVAVPSLAVFQARMGGALSNLV